MLNKIFKFILNLIFKFRRKKINNIIKKILFIRFDNKIGDTIIESFFLRELKNINSEIILDVIILEPYNKIIENNPYINKIYSIPFGKNKWIKSFYLIPYLRKQRYDLIIDIPTKPTLKRLFYCYLINSTKVMSANVSGYDFINYQLTWKQDCHISNIFVKALNLLGIKDIYTRYELFISNEDKEYVNVFINKNNLNNKKIFIFNPKGSTSTRSLNKENIKKILNFLQKYKQYSIILLDYKKEYSEFKNLAILYTSNNIMRVASLIQRSKYVLTTDTGIVHVADVYEKPMTVLYSDVFKEGDKPRDKSYIKEWCSINPITKRLRDMYNVNNIDVNDIISVLDKEMRNNE